MTTRQLLLATWHWHPSVLLGCGALLVGYAAGLRFRLGVRAALYVSGVLFLLLALLSPIHELGDSYLFSAHMLQHLLLLLVVPPLLLLGLPPSAIEAALRRTPVRQIERALGQPLGAWIIGNGMMWLWHLPALYNAALVHETIHIIEHICFIVSATIFWWPVIVPGPLARLQPLGTMLYLFAAMIASGILGMILTFAAPGLYPAYLNPPDPFNILPLIRGSWGLTPPVDQQLGGLLMWVPGSFAYLFAILATLARWYRAPDDAEIGVQRVDRRVMGARESSG